ncbi:MAG: IPT/TIG domain-containing protein [Pyrinomonadaceae bacterium]|nr:IPT/TIG domain-containing protein [Pyrinomonadaceae bacterium]
MARLACLIVLHLTLILALAGSAQAQTNTFHLHKDTSTATTPTSTNLLQLKTTGPDSASVAVASSSLKNVALGEYFIRYFETQTGVPNTPGLIPSGSTITFSLWMNKTGTSGTLYPRAKLYLNSAGGTLICTVTGTTALTTTLTKYTLAATTTSNIILTGTDRFYLWVGVNLTAAATANNTAALNVEGTLNGNYDSQFSIPAPIPPPSISGLSTSSGTTGTSVTINGSNFGATQGTSTVTFNGVAATPTSWSNTSITASVPSSANTGQVVVNVRGMTSNGADFTVTPKIDSISPTGGPTGTSVNITGSAFGSSQGTSTVKFNGVTAMPGSWSNTSINATVPSSATTGPVVITVGGNASNSLTFTVATHGSISGKVTKLDGVTVLAGASVKVYQGATQAGATTTNSTGDYSFSSLTPGTYRVEATYSGYATGSRGAAVTYGTDTAVNLSLEEIVTGNVSYIYDELGRLSSVVGPTETVTYSYDSVGNLLSISRSNSGQVSILGFTPGSGSVGASVTVNGTGFSATPGQNTVTFNGVTATVTSSTSTQIVTNVPAGATTGNVGVTTPAGSATSATAFTVTSASGAPTITGFTPAIGTVGSSVNITGTNFETVPTNNRVKINGTGGIVDTATTSTLATTITSGTVSGRISVATPAGNAVSSSDFFVPPAPYTAADVDTTGRMSIGENRAFSVGTANKVGLLIFDGVAGQKISLVLSNITGNNSVRVYGPNGSYVGAVDGDFMDAKTLPFTGTYTILLAPLNGGTGGATFRLYDVVDVTAPITPGGVPLVATVSAPGGNIAMPFNGTAGQRVSLNIYSTFPGIDYQPYYLTSVMIKAPDGTTVGYAYMNHVTNAFIEPVTLPVTGTYTIVYDAYRASTGSMTLTLYNVPPDSGGPISVGGALEPYRNDVPGQNIEMPFEGTAGQKVSVRMTNGTMPGALFIRKPDGTNLASVNVGNDGGFLDAVTLPVSGTYKLYFDPTGAYTGQMSFTLYNASDITGTLTPGGSSLPVAINVPGQRAVLTFSGTAGQRVNLSMTNGSFYWMAWSNVYVYLYNPDGSALASLDLNGQTTALIDTLTLGSTGTYTIILDPPDTRTGGVTFTLNDVPPDVSGTITPGGPSVTKSNTVGGQNIAVTFDGTAGQRVSLNTVIQGFTRWPYVSIYKPDGNRLVGPANGYIDALTLPVTGTYKILGDPFDLETGQMTFTLYDVVDVTGTITPGGSSVTSTVTTPGQNIRLTFDGTAGQQVNLGISGNTFPFIAYAGAYGSYVSVLKPDGVSMFDVPMNGSSSGSTGTLTLPATGTYTVFYNAQGMDTGQMTFTLNTVP